MDQAEQAPKQIVIQDDVEGDTSPDATPQQPAVAGESMERPAVAPTPASQSVSVVNVPPRPLEHGAVAMPKVFADRLGYSSQGSSTPKRNMLVLQWLTYVFWWWFVAAATWLVGVLADIMVTGAKPMDYTGSLLALPAIAMLVSLVAAVAADTLYSRGETGHGGRAARILQTVHAVIFAVTIVGGLITIAYYLFGGVFGAGYTADGRSVALITAFASITLYALAFARIMFPAVKGWARIAIMAILGVVAVVLIAVALSGPAARARNARDDALLERSLSALADKVNAYALENKTLPEALSKLDFTEENSEGIYGNDKAKEAVARNLVRYTPNIPAPNNATSSKSSSSSFYGVSAPTDKTLYYRMCVTYKTVKKGSSYSSYSESSSVVSTEPDVNKHPIGEKCYDLRTSSSSSRYDSSWYDDIMEGAETGAGSASSSSSATTKSSTSSTVKN